MKTVLKGLALTVGLLFVVGVIWLSVSFFGDPISAWLARRTMENYLAETYPDRSFTLQKVHYDFKFHRYDAEVLEGSDHFFTMSGSPGKVQYDQYKYTFAMDEALTNRFSAQLEAELEGLLKPYYPQLGDVRTDFYVAKGAYPADAQFTQGMEREVKVEAFLIGQEIPALEFARLCTGVRDAMLQSGYRPASLRCLYNEPEVLDGKEGMLLYTLKIEQDGFTAPVEALQAGVEEFNLKHREK